MIATNPASTCSCLLVLVLSGCALNTAPPSAPDRSELGRELKAFEAPLDWQAAEPADPDPLQPGSVLTLEEALRFAVARNPRLASYSWRIRAREAGTLQAGLLPNPTIGVEVENFAGSGEASGFDGSETTVWLSQPFELGGKRRKRHELATLQQQLARWDYQAALLDVVTDTRQRFIGVLAAQERLALADETLELAGEMLKTVSRRVDAGRVSSAEASKASVTLESARIEQDHAQHHLESARAQLAAIWDGTASPSFRAVGDLRRNGALPAFESLLGRLARSPELARWETEIAEREAAVRLEKAAAVPDVTVSAGYRRLEETDDDAMVFESSLPLPLSNRNQGAILQARYELARARERHRQARLQLRITLREVYETALEAEHTADLLQNAVLPAAERAFDIIRDGYRNGRFSYLEVLDAQRTLFATREELIETLTETERTRAALERLVAAPLHGVSAQRREQ